MSNLILSISLIGGLGFFQCILLKTSLVLLILCNTVLIVECGSYDRTLEAPLLSPVAQIPSVMAHTPLSLYLSNYCKKDMVLKRGSEGFLCVYPAKLDLFLLNVSQNPDWNLFLDELAAQLGVRETQIELINFYVHSLSALNISMYITPQKDISFSAYEASKINSSLIFHKVRLDSRFVGDYRFLNLTWFKPPPPSKDPTFAASTVKTPGRQELTATSSSTSDRGRHSNLIVILGIVTGILIISIICLLILCLCTLRPKTKTPPIETEKPRIEHTISSAGSLPYPTSTRFISYEDLREATNNFESASILGEGGFGRVFKGVLNDGTAVAIKRLTNGGQPGGKEFLVEVEMLSRLHHRNLVKLVGYYSNPDSSQNLLCYELVPNGSLEAWLHGPLGINCPLDWDTRMKIALDAARGLAYLHEDSQPCVIHRDFKASNILLENNFHAKVADFGLAKLAPEGGVNYQSTRVMGTFGYVAPEYAMTGHLLVKSDVYSYGVVLLELLTGKKPVEMSQPTGQENLVTWARPILRDKDRLDEIADPKLGGKYPNEDFVRVCTIAAACVAPEANQRPTMGEVVQSLKMVQRITEYHDSVLASSNTQTNLRQSSSTFEFDGASSQLISDMKSSLVPPVNQVELPLEVTNPSNSGAHLHIVSQYAGPLHIPFGTLMEDEKVAPLSLSDQLPSAQGLLQANTAPAPFQLPTQIHTIGTHVIINPKLSGFGLQIHFQRAVPIAMDRAIKEIVSSIVQRSVSIATQTTKELVLKDYAMESEEKRVKNAAHLMVASLAGSLAHVTCKEPYNHEPYDLNLQQKKHGQLEELSSLLQKTEDDYNRQVRKSQAKSDNCRRL